MVGKKIDEKIHRLLSSGSTKEEGFRLLISYYKEKIYWFVRRQIKNHNDTDDIVQNTFIKVFRKYHQFQGASKFSTWLYQIASREIIDFLRKEKKFISENEETITDMESTSIHEFSSEQIMMHLKNALDTLPTKQRLIYEMRYFDELKYNEIANILNISEGSLKASYHIATKKIKAYITQLDYYG